MPKSHIISKEKLSLKDVRPTVYFIKEDIGLKQGVDVVLINKGKPLVAELKMLWDRDCIKIKLGEVVPGENILRVYIPDIREEKIITFKLSAAGDIISERKIKWLPTRHWTVYITQQSHFDPGYTNLPSNVLLEYLEFLDNAVEWCEKTENWHSDCRFHYTVEQAWIVLYYAQHRSEEQIRKFAYYCKNGQLEVTALFANMTSELLGPEETARLLYPAFQLKRKYDIPIRVAEHNDIPGVNWAYATVLSDAGIKYFAPHLPNYFYWDGNHYPMNFDEKILRPKPYPQLFYWEAQNGKKVLFFGKYDGIGGTSNPSLDNIPRELQKLESLDYPYDIHRCVVSGAGRDNAPPILDYSITVRQWNQKWTYPRYILSNFYEFFSALENKIGEEVPIFRGDYPGTDYTLGSLSTAQDTGISRLATDELLASERWATIAAKILNYKYPIKMLQQAYLDLLKFDEHVWGLCCPTGWGADASSKERSVYSARAMSISEDILSKSATLIADNIKIIDDCPHIIVFNPLERERSEMLSMSFVPEHTCDLNVFLCVPKSGETGVASYGCGSAIGHWYNRLPEELAETGLTIIDVETGKIVPHQLTRLTDPTEPMHFAGERYSMSAWDPPLKHYLHFPVSNVPALGYKSYKVLKGSSSKPPKSDLIVTETNLENSFYKISIDPNNGCVTSIYDKELDRELVDKKACYKLNQLFCKRAGLGTLECNIKPAAITAAEGSIIAKLIIKSQLPGVPLLTQEIILYNNLKRIDFNQRLLKDTDGSWIYYLAFPFAVNKPKFRYESSLNVIKPVEDQLPGTQTDYYIMQHWVDVSDGKGNWGITLTSREAPMIQLGGNWHDYCSQAHHGVLPDNFLHKFLSSPYDFKKGHIYSYLATNNFRTNFHANQPGQIVLRYSLTTHRGDWLAGGARDFGWRVCNPLFPVVTLQAQDGLLPTKQSFCAIDKHNVILLTIKQAEDDNGLIVRLFETEGKSVDVKLTLPFLNIAKAILTSVVEEDKYLLSSDLHSFKVAIEPWSLATIRLISL